MDRRNRNGHLGTVAGLTEGHRGSRPYPARSILTYYPVIVRSLAGLSLVALGLSLALAGALALPTGRAWLRRVLAPRSRLLIGFAWTTALVATTGSLYFSDVVGFPPCAMCWYQRICMYPLVLVLGVGLLRNEPEVWRFALPLPVLGIVIAVYHVIIQYRPGAELLSCGAGPPCSGRYLFVLGFLSIPMMAGIAFLLIITLFAVVAASGREPA